ncbi:unannotated protein [freshwater metagenome]|uniref:Unannotated protein n=1 Tax=freshwater metagenome TaxID=449393 RepID=A0A6J7HEL4_9ZZZZ
MFTRVRTGWSVTVAMVSRNARVRFSVEQVSTIAAPRRPTSRPVLLTHQVPSGWT